MDQKRDYNKIIKICESHKSLDKERVLVSVSMSSIKKIEEIDSKYINHTESDKDKQLIGDS
jgi:hypothetical protein